MDEMRLETLIAWLEEESPSRHAAGVNAMVDRVLAEVAGGAGGAVGAERIAGRDGLGDMLVLRAGPRRAEGAALMIAHLDTVHPLGTTAGALPVRIDGDRLYGPGVYDMKGGAFAGLAAFLAAARDAKRPLIFAFSPDEEIGSPTSRPVIEALAREAAFALVLEPARDGGGCVTARKAVGRFAVAVEGREAHAGMRHQDGRSAIREAAHQVLAVEALTDYAAGVTTSVGLIRGGTGLNVIPRTCEFEIDLRAPSDAAACRCVAAIRGLRPLDPDVKLSVVGGLNRPAYERSPQSAALYERARAHATRIGFELAEAPQTGGGSDGNFTAALGVPTLDGLGMEGAGAHTLQEHGLVSCLPRRRALIAALLAD